MDTQLSLLLCGVFVLLDRLDDAIPALLVAGFSIFLAVHQVRY